MKSSIRALAPLLCLPLLVGAFGCQRPTETAEPSRETPSATVPQSAETEYDPAHYVVIRTAEDLTAFHRAVNQDEYDFRGMTVIFLADIDLSDFAWTPLKGDCLAGVTFDGQGHTLRGLRLPDYEYSPEDAVPESDKGCGFIGVTTADVTFRNLTLEDTSVNAFDHSVGNFIGAVQGGIARFENCRSVGFQAEGWMDPSNRDPAAGGHPVAVRMGGFVGYVGREGGAAFTDCAVEGLSLRGYQNLAGFVGYDGSGTLSPQHFTGCRLHAARLTFAYPPETEDGEAAPLRAVAVFYNAADQSDTLRGCLDRGNRYEDVLYYAYSRDGAIYIPEGSGISDEKE